MAELLKMIDRTDSFNSLASKDIQKVNKLKRALTSQLKVSQLEYLISELEDYVDKKKEMVEKANVHQKRRMK